MKHLNPAYLASALGLMVGALAIAQDCSTPTSPVLALTPTVAGGLSRT